MKEQINEQLTLLEKELSRLKSVTDYIDDTKKTAQVVVNELKDIQKNYSVYSEKLFDLYETSVEQIKKETELQIKEGVIHFETTGSQIDQTNREKLLETKRLLENYRKTVEATSKLVGTLESVDFPARLNAIENRIVQNFDSQNKQHDTTRIMLFVIIGLICIGGIVEILSSLNII